MLGIEVQWLPTKVMDMDVIAMRGEKKGKNSRHRKGEKGVEILSQNWRLHGSFAHSKIVIFLYEDLRVVL